MKTTWELFGSEAPLDHTGPGNMEHNGQTGHPTEQFFGSTTPLSTKPEGVTQFNAGTGKMDIEYVGSATRAPLDTTPDGGWQDHNVHLSDRARKQSEKT